ncbi:hypothetical protein KY348_06065 [Candidatus Woesearchaeota archaeon]|nr:hypothetical protein [Candidatus Woesearchaeota archaeon]
MKPPEVAVDTESLDLEKRIAATPERKTFVYDSDNVIASDRYKICVDEKGEKVVHGQGQWGIVYRFFDNLLGEYVAIKVPSPKALALEQMNYRNIDLFRAVKKEAGKRKLCANVVPTEFELDAEGRPFNTMPEYYATFVDVMETAAEREEVNMETEYGGQKPFKSGLYIDEIIGYLNCMTNGLSDFHKKEQRVLCDIKLDNIMVEVDHDEDISNLKKVKQKVKEKLKQWYQNGWEAHLADKGTATYASVENHSGPRDNMGDIITRHPDQFVEGADPRRKHDVYALASLAYMMFEGKFPFQDEIQRLMKNGGKEKVAEYMRKFSVVRAGISEKFDGIEKRSLSLSEKIDTKLNESGIPLEFKDVIGEGLRGYKNCDDGIKFKNMLIEAERNYRARVIGEEAVKKLKKKTRNWMLGAVGAYALLIGALWVAYTKTKPDYREKADAIARMEYRIPENSDVTFLVDQKPINQYLASEKQIMPASLNQSGFRMTREQYVSHNRFGGEKKGVIYQLTYAYLEAMWDANDDNLRPLDYVSRFHQNVDPDDKPDEVGMALALNGIPFENYLRCLSKVALNLNAIYENNDKNKKAVISLADTVTSLYGGIHKTSTAQKISKSFKFNDYIKAAYPGGERIFSEKEERFLRQVMYNITQRMPQNIRLE